MLRTINTVSVLAATTVFPFLALAHGGVDDGHPEGVAVTGAQGGSALLHAFSLQWFGLLAVSLLLIALLSYLVRSYLDVKDPPKDASQKSSDKK